MSATESINPMQKPRVEKVVINIAIGKSGEQLQKAMTVLERMVNQKPCQRGAKKAVRDWGTRKGEPIACIATLRGENAIAFITRSLDSLGNKLPQTSFDLHGNFAYGVKEHIELAGVRYEPTLGIFGMDVCVTMKKPGYSIKKRRIRKSKVGKGQVLTPEEAIVFVKENFGTEITE